MKSLCLTPFARLSRMFLFIKSSRESNMPRDKVTTTSEINRCLMAMKKLIADNRQSCLWFLREDYDPVDPREILDTLKHVEEWGDRKTYLEARRLREWYSRISSAVSVS